MRFAQRLLGWIGLTSYVVIYDTLAIHYDWPTLSNIFGDALDHPIKRWPVLVVWGALTLHLFAALLPAPVRRTLAPYDPLGRMAQLVPQKNG